MNPRGKFLYVCGLVLALIVAAMLFPFAGGAAPQPQTGSQGPASKARELADFDAFGAQIAKDGDHPGRAVAASHVHAVKKTSAGARSDG